MNYDMSHWARRPEPSEIGSPEMRLQIGKELRTAREFHQMSLEQVVAVTRIGLRYLEEIEAGRWAFLPPTYVKVFIVSFADAVGLDSAKMRKQLDEVFPSPWTFANAAEIEPGYGSDTIAQPRPPTTNLVGWADSNRTFIFYSAIGAVVIALALIYIFRPIPTPVKPDARPAPIMGRALTSSTPAEEAEPQAEEPAAPSEPPYAVSIITHDTCYVRVATADSVLYEHTLWPGNDVTLQPRAPVTLTLGNASGAMIVVNGDTLRPQTGAERVKLINIDRTGFRR